MSRNDGIIEEFRCNAGRVGGAFAGRPLLLLHHRGAKTGTWRVSPLMYQKVGDGYAIFASKGGAPSHPDWFHNIRAHPDVKIEVGADKVDVHARVAAAGERKSIWDKQKALWPNFAEYEARTDREIPVVVLEPA